ncbi:MAG: DUF6152 family protein [Vicinamibacterales bacterium]
MRFRLQAVALLVALVSVPTVSAHHAWPVNQERLVTVKGTVTSVIWANPHPMIAIDVRNDAGEVEKWSIGGPAINRMVANGWSSSTVKPGDEITGIGYQFRDGSKVIRLERVMLPDGREMRVYARR